MAVQQEIRQKLCTVLPPLTDVGDTILLFKTVGLTPIKPHVQNGADTLNLPITTVLFNHFVFPIVMSQFLSYQSDPHLPADCQNEKVDFSRYISIGDSLTAGCADKSLYLEGQQNSYPEILSAQMKAVGGGNFSSPFFNAGEENGDGHLQLVGWRPGGKPVIRAVTTNLAVRDQVTIPGGKKINLLTKYHGPLGNLGVPYIRLSDIISENFGNVNGFFERVLPAPHPLNKTSYLDFITDRRFTFFSCWLGSNDVLLYAATGSSSQEDRPTDKATFDKLYHILAEKLTSDGAKGVLVTIPDITKTALYNTVTYTSLLETVQASKPDVKELYIEAGESVVRAGTPEDLFTLSFGSARLLGRPDAHGRLYGLDPASPVRRMFVLSKSEVAYVRELTASYNATIRAVAASKNLALYDVHHDLNQIASPEGITENGIKFTNSYISGNLFSLDGIHLTPRGYAHVANEIIRAINEKYSSNIPLTDVSTFRAIKTL